MRKLTHRALVALSVVLPATALAQAPLSAEDAFARLKSFAGSWQAPREGGGVIRLTYRVISGDSALVESFTTPSGRETLSVYHLDGRRLLLTHYCALGNQPRLRYAPETSGCDRLVFVFLDATNLAAPEAEHMTRFEVTFVGPDRFDQTSTYRQGGKEETTTLKLSRVPSG